jgi:predicted metal-dependent hydrolase
MDRKMLPPQLRLIAKYFRPGFHPNDFDDRAYLAAWYAASAA